jgi:hypothetical protein
MMETGRPRIVGHVKITDLGTQQVLVNKMNAIKGHI